MFENIICQLGILTGALWPPDPLGEKFPTLAGLILWSLPLKHFCVPCMHCRTQIPWKITEHNGKKLFKSSLGIWTRLSIQIFLHHGSWKNMDHRGIMCCRLDVILQAQSFSKFKTMSQTTSRIYLDYYVGSTKFKFKSNIHCFWIH